MVSLFPVPRLVLWELFSVRLVFGFLMFWECEVNAFLLLIVILFFIRDFAEFF